MSAKFVPPKLDMGSGFAVAGSMNARQYKKSNKDTGTPSSNTSKRKLQKQKTVRDTVPLTLINLSKYFDWRRGQFDESPTLFKLASIIWLYLPKQEMNEYTVNFSSATDNSVCEANMNIMAGPPAIVTTSPKGEVLVMVENMKKLIEYAEKQFLLILYPYIDNCKFIEDATVQTAGGEHCTYWEIDGIEHLTHIAMDKYGIIYFTTGESVYRIVKTEGDMYLDNYEDIFTPSNDTSHITSLWRQGNDIYLTIQDWENESAIDVYKVRPPKDKGVSTPDSPTGKRARSPSFGNSRSRTRSRSNSGYGSDYGGSSPRSSGTANDSNDFVNKVRTFSLQFNSRIWQLGTMRFEKKFILSIGAAQMGNVPQLLQIGFKKKIKAMNLMGSKKNIIWPKSAPDEVPHTIAFHKQTKTWFCLLPVTNTKYKDGVRSYWVQFRLDKTKKKIIWQRLVQIPDEAKGGFWLHYDDVRDLLIGFSKVRQDENEYVFRFLPDMTKHLWIEFKDEDDKKVQDQPGMQMQRSFRRTRKGSKEKPSLRRNSSGKTPTMKNGVSNSSTTSENNIKPSKAKKESKANSTVVEPKKIKPKNKKKKSTKTVDKKKDNKKDNKKDVKKDDKPKGNANASKSNGAGGKRGSGKVDVKKIKPKKKDKDDKKKNKDGKTEKIKPNGGPSPPKDEKNETDAMAAATAILSKIVTPVNTLSLEEVESNSTKDKDKKEEKSKDETGAKTPKTPKSPVNKYKRKRKVTNRKGGNTPKTRKGTKSNGSTPVSPRKQSSSPRKGRTVIDYDEEDVMD